MATTVFHLPLLFFLGPWTLTSGAPLDASLSVGSPAMGGPAAVKECELTTGRTLTIIKSVGFPAKYGSNVDCEYTVRRRSRSVCSVTFLFNVMDLEQSENCSKDYLMLKGEKMCGSKPIGFSRTVSFSEKDQVTMSFHSDNETRGLGYMVTVVQQDCPIPSCDATFDSVDFVLESPNHPLPYDNGRTCAYLVKKSDPAVCRLILKVESFDVEPDPECNSDYLMVNGDRLCGVMTEGQILDISFTNTTMLMEFQSDHVTTRDGFKLNVHQQSCDLSTPTATSTPQPSTSTELSTSVATDADTSTTSNLPNTTTE